MVNGFLAGLVGITCPCYWVSDVGACAIGAVAGLLVILAMDLLEHLRIDDPVGAWPVHGVCGIWGTLSLGAVCQRRISSGRLQSHRRAGDCALFARVAHRLVLRRWDEGAVGAMRRQPGGLRRNFRQRDGDVQNCSTP